MRLYLVRHGQSLNNTLYEQGRAHERVFDPPLTEAGQEQARLVGEYLATADDMPGLSVEKFNITHLYCSAMTRAMQTAQPIGEALGINPEIWVDVHELGGLFLSDEKDNVTSFPGLNREEISEKFPNYVLPEQVTDDGWWNLNPQVVKPHMPFPTFSEAPPDFVARVLRVYHTLLDRVASDDRIAIVSHGGFMSLIIKAFLRQLPESPDTLFYTHYNTAITRFDFGEGYQGGAAPVDRMRLHYLNRVNHLPSNLWTW